MRVTINGLLIALCVGCAILSLAGCNSPSSGKGNEPTYSGNGKGEAGAVIIQECAFMAAEQDPSLNRDAIFVLCLDENGVWAI